MTTYAPPPAPPPKPEPVPTPVAPSTHERIEGEVQRIKAELLRFDHAHDPRPPTPLNPAAATFVESYPLATMSAYPYVNPATLPVWPRKGDWTPPQPPVPPVTPEPPPVAPPPATDAPAPGSAWQAALADLFGPAMLPFEIAGVTAFAEYLKANLSGTMATIIVAASLGVAGALQTYLTQAGQTHTAIRLAAKAVRLGVRETWQ